MISLITCTVQHIYCLGDRLKDVDMGGACSTYGRDKKCIQSFDRKT
jgi:hypothetical protein